MPEITFLLGVAGFFADILILYLHLHFARSSVRDNSASPNIFEAFSGIKTVFKEIWPKIQDTKFDF